MVDADRRRLVLRIATAHHSCLVRSKGQPSATMVRKQRGGFEKVFSFRGASKLLDADLVRVDDAVKFDGSVTVDDEVGERWRSRWKTFSSAPGEKR
jgi:hypothetical protein